VTPLTIAVDGPSGSGKSSVSQEVARRLGLAYLDTGAMYRVACWSVLAHELDPDDADAVAAHVADLSLDMPTDPDEQTIRAEGHDVTAAIRGAEVTGAVSRVAANLAVRATLRERQRAIIADEGRGSRCGIVAEGRDITTVVAPEADVRILLTASEEARLARRAREVHGSDDAAAVAATRGQILDRDAADSAVSSFHTAADGVVHLDSSALDFEQTVQAVLDIVTLTAGISAFRLDEVSQARS
jgi:cytidylate kinase